LYGQSFISEGVTYSFLGAENLPPYYPNSEAIPNGLNADGEDYVLGEHAFNILDSYASVSLQATSAAFADFLHITGVNAEITEGASADINIIGDDQRLNLGLGSAPAGLTHGGDSGPDIWRLKGTPRLIGRSTTNWVTRLGWVTPQTAQRARNILSCRILRMRRADSEFTNSN
jgi:hypothetical protein